MMQLVLLDCVFHHAFAAEARGMPKNTEDHIAEIFHLFATAWFRGVGIIV